MGLEMLRPGACLICLARRRFAKGILTTDNEYLPTFTYRTRPRKRMWANRSKTFWRRHGQHLSSSCQLQNQRANAVLLAGGGLTRDMLMERRAGVSTKRQQRERHSREAMPSAMDAKCGSSGLLQT